MNKIFLPLIALIIVLSGACSSVSYRKTIREPERLFHAGQPMKAAQMLKKYVNTSGKNQLLFLMECGYMLHAAGDYKTSNKVFLKAGKMATVKPISASKQVASYLTNDRNTNYRGEDFEKVLIHFYTGLNFIMLKNYNSARVEFKKVNNELAKIKTKNGKARYKQNIIAKYLTAISYELIGNIDNNDDDREFAYIEYKQIYNLRPRLRMVQRDLLRLSKQLKYKKDYAKWRRQFGRIDYIPRNAGEIVFVYGSGRAPIKVSRGKLLNDRSMYVSITIAMSTMRFAAGVTTGMILAAMNKAENPIPNFRRRRTEIKTVRLRVGNRVYYPAMLENIEDTAIWNLQDNYKNLKKRVAGSLVAKAAASIAAGIAAKVAGDRLLGRGLGSLLGAVAGGGTAAALFSSMRPDLRCWHSLPGQLHLSRIFLRPGKYNVTLEYLDRYNQVVKTKKMQVVVEKGKKVFLKERTLN